MTAREEIVGTAATMYTLERQKWNDQNYPYWAVESYWQTPETAKFAYDKAVSPAFNNDKFRIVKTVLNVHNTGRMYLSDIAVVYESGEWNVKYDPRQNDPDWKTYIRLKEKFND